MTDKQKLNSLRKMAGIPQDFTPDKKVSVTEDVIPGMSQVLRGGKNKFYLVTEAKKTSDLGDVITEVDFPALANIIVGASKGENVNFREWELFAHNQQNEAVNEARTRMVTEATGQGAWAQNPDNTPLPDEDELDDLEGRDDLEGEDELDDLEGEDELGLDLDDGEERPEDEFDDIVAGLEDKFRDYEDEMSDRATRAGFEDDDEDDELSDEDADALSRLADDPEDDEFMESKKAKPDFADIDGDGDETETAKKAAKDKKAKEEQEEKMADKDYDGDGKVETKTAEWKGSRDKAIKKQKMKESSHYHTSDNYPETHKDGKRDVPHNVDAQYDTVWDKNDEQSQQQGNDYQMANDTTPVKVPAKVLNELKRVIDELKAESEKHKRHNLDHESGHYYEDTADAFQIVHDHLAMKTVEGLKKAQYYSHRMMNIQRVHMPDLVWKFIVDGGSKRSLKAYMNDVKEPVTGQPRDTVGIDVLNKNTHTE